MAIAFETYLSAKKIVEEYEAERGRIYIELGRDNLCENSRIKPLSEISLSDFKDTSITQWEIEHACLIKYCHGTNNKILKARWKLVDIYD